jgi:hypothetical protein
VVKLRKPYHHNIVDWTELLLELHFSYVCMSLYVCLYDMYVCVYIYVWMDVRMYLCMHICVYMCLRVYLCMYVCRYVLYHYRCLLCPQYSCILFAKYMLPYLV